MSRHPAVAADHHAGLVVNAEHLRCRGEVVITAKPAKAGKNSAVYAYGETSLKHYCKLKRRIVVVN